MTNPTACQSRGHNYIHGHANPGHNSPTYKTWRSMKVMCTLKGRDNAKTYEGITFCDRWRSFTNFLADMGERPQGKTLDRIDSKKGYSPENCRWATASEQVRNTSRTKITFDVAVEIALARLDGESCKSITLRLGCPPSIPSSISMGKCWKDAMAKAKQIRGIA